VALPLKDKPMTSKGTRQAPGHAEQKRQAPGEPEPASAAQSAASHADVVNILIVDDEPKNLIVLESLLDDPGYRVVRAQSADQALLALVAEDFALLILDIRMPDMNGFELAQMIKERKKTAQVPIIFLTAYYNEDQHVLVGYGNGAVDYLHKPVNATILRSKVAIFAELYRKSRECGLANHALLIEVSQRRLAEQQMRQLNDTLEQRVAQRTEALRASEEKYRNLFDSIDEGFCILEKVHGDTDAQLDFRHIEVNPAFEIHAGVGNVVGKTLRQAFPDLTEQWYLTYDTILGTGEPSRFELELSAGGPVLELYAFRVEGKTQSRVAVIFKDISVRKRVDLELKDALATAEKANRAKSEFLSSMSHELRSPLSAILGFAQLMGMESPALAPTHQNSAKQILKAGWYLLELINEILDLAQIESGRMSMSLESLSLDELLRDCEAMIEPQARKSGVRVRFADPEAPLFVLGDYTRVKQVFVNLLSNAIKYNRAGGSVEVSCSACPDERVRVSFCDTGEGLSADKLAQLFQPFNRLGQETGLEEGTGIGLVVSKQLIEFMGGAIGVQSTVGVGSVFWIELAAAHAVELKLVSGDLTSAAADSGAQQRTVLSIEDNPANVLLISKLLAFRPDIRLLSAMDATQGLAIANEALPDVILMDINLPGISGITALGLLAGNPLTAHIPVVAISANAMPRDIEKGLAAGFFRYLTKPIHVSKFMETLDVALEHARAGAVGAVQRPQASEHPIRPARGGPP